MSNQTTALVRAEHVPAPFEPTDLDQAFTLAENLSQASLLPAYLRNKPHDVFMTLLLGRDLGLTAMQAISGIHVIDGKPSVSAGTAVALVKRSPLCKYFVLADVSDEAATYETLRVGDPKPSKMTYSMADARRAGLAAKKNWAAHPAAMLRARCAMALARDVYPDVVANIYDDEELAEMRAEMRARADSEITEVMTAPPPPPPKSLPPAPAAAKAPPPPSSPPPGRGPGGPGPMVTAEVAAQSKRDLAEQRKPPKVAPPSTSAEAPTELRAPEPAAEPPWSETGEVNAIDAAIWAATTWAELGPLGVRMRSLSINGHEFVLDRYIATLIKTMDTAETRAELDEIGDEVRFLKDALQLTVGQSQKAAAAFRSARTRLTKTSPGATDEDNRPHLPDAA